ncbi:bifunctional hydroxymethylpyrimidine kinase/phosphomethylpyrimidine kinase [Pseudarthrobacter sp. J1763]|uniref:bifunctional hydroxymethylpyrimidine kinase/phosphomethylpyrimidine kinase n=1 Tax=Pseudarthrobacter sp. J1763 TaxID=3420445 RepID=UPI003D2B43E1
MATELTQPSIFPHHFALTDHPASTPETAHNGQQRIPRVLSIAGSDPSGGAGIQADLKSIAANGGYGMAVITALTAQNTRGVQGVHVPPTVFLNQQLESISADIDVDAVKIGMLGNAEVIRTVAAWLTRTQPAVVVLDPVMVASSGDRLLDPDAEAAMRELLPLADLITPNIPELAALLGEPVVQSWAEALEQGKRLAAELGSTVLVKGGHLDGPVCPDALINTVGFLAEEVVLFESARVDTRNTHGTGCSLSSALATIFVSTQDWVLSVREAKSWLVDALESADQLNVGSGHGPVNHFHALWNGQAWSGHQPTSTPNGTAGEHAREWWRLAAESLSAIYKLGFIKELSDGSLSAKDFAYYLSQDALYLNGYSRVLQRASELAPHQGAKDFWAHSAAQCIEVEAELHRNWLSSYADGGFVGSPIGITPPGPVTQTYLDHLDAAAAQGNYPVVVAAVLPCFWLYAEVGAVLYAQFCDAGEPATHPYAQWLKNYADEEFAEATRTAITLADEAAVRASAPEREAMKTAFAAACQYEVEFFDAPRRHG